MTTISTPYERGQWLVPTCGALPFIIPIALAATSTNIALCNATDDLNKLIDKHFKCGQIGCKGDGR